MTDLGTNEHHGEPQSRRRPRRWRGALLGAGLIGLGAISGFAIGKAQAAPWWMWAGSGHHFNSERMAKRVDRRVEKVLSRVDASEEQTAKVRTIAKTAIADLAALNLNPRESRAKFVELLRADTIDPAAFEALRAEQIEAADAASKRLVQGLTESASVLTVEQRRELTEHWHERLSEQKDR